MNVYFGNQQIIEDSQQIEELGDPSQPIKIDFLMDDLYGYYLLVMYDLDAPFPENNTMSPFIHYLIVNIPGTESIPEAGEIVYQYLPPSPPKTSDPHRYVISIYKQPGAVNVEPTNSILHRKNFPIDQFVHESGLTLVDTAMFTFGHEKLSITPRSSHTSRTSLISPYSRSVTPNNSPASSYQSKDIRPRFLSQQLGTVARKLHFNQSSSSWFKSNTTLTEAEQKYCRCTIKAASKQPESCLVERAWYQTRGGKTCSNPYAVCAKSVGVSTKECGENYNFETMPDHYLRTYILMMYHTMINRGVVIPTYTNKDGSVIPIEMDRQQMLDIIHQYKASY